MSRFTFATTLLTHPTENRSTALRLLTMFELLVALGFIL